MDSQMTDHDRALIYLRERGYDAQSSTMTRIGQMAPKRVRDGESVPWWQWIVRYYVEHPDDRA